MMHPTPPQLLADLSAAPTPDEQELRAWMAAQSVFVSSVMGGMAAERAAAVGGVEAVGGRAVFFEDFGGQDDDPEDAYLGNVAASDIYLGILGRRYGARLKSGYSATHAEYNEAVRRGLRISAWTAAGGLDGPQQDFLTDIRLFHTTGTYASPADLRTRVEARLRVLAAEATAPWVKIGNLILRATHVHDDGATITITAWVRSNDVASALEAMRPGNGFGRNSDTRITWPGRTELARVDTVASSITTSRARTMTMTATRLPDDTGSASTRMSVNGYGPDDLVEIALREAFFHESNPLESMRFAATATNPLPALDGLGLSEDAYEQIARLLVTEEVTGTLHAGRVTQFQLSPPRTGSRRLRLGWMPPKPYINVEPIEKVIEGEVPTPHL